MSSKSPAGVSAKAGENVAKVPRDAVKTNDAPPSRERGGYDGDTAFKLYLREIGQVKLLTPQEEIELAARPSAACSCDRRKWRQ